MVIFTSFLAADIDNPVLGRDLGYALLGQKLLKALVPNSRYVVLTDRETAPFLERYIDISVTAPSDTPLMIKILTAQRNYMGSACGDLVIVADTDCFPNRDLSAATPINIGLATTHRGKKFSYKINNIGYSRDHDLTAWFLSRALDILVRWPAEKHHWWGDQDAWEAALDDFGVRCIPDQNDIFSVPIQDRVVHVYPCDSHNCMTSAIDGMKPTRKRAFLLHFKGPRKQRLDEFLAQEIDHVAEWKRRTALD